MDALKKLNKKIVLDNDKENNANADADEVSGDRVVGDTEYEKDWKGWYPDYWGTSTRSRVVSNNAFVNA